MLGRVLLLSGGKTDISFVKGYLAEESFDTVVCADSGLEAAAQLKLPVDYFMGDFDSVSPETLEKYQQSANGKKGQAQWIQYPRRKDATDTHMVLDWILERHPGEIVILGATGGRLDHFLANLNLLMLPMRQEIPAYIVDPWNKIYLIDRDIVVRRREVFGKYISLQPMTSEVTGITLEGFEYPLDNATLQIGGSWGISNELAEGVEEAHIHLREGVLAVIESRDYTGES